MQINKQSRLGSVFWYVKLLKILLHWRYFHFWDMSGRVLSRLEQHWRGLKTFIFIIQSISVLVNIRYFNTISSCAHTPAKVTDDFSLFRPPISGSSSLRDCVDMVERKNQGGYLTCERSWSVEKVKRVRIKTLSVSQKKSSHCCKLWTRCDMWQK